MALAAFDPELVRATMATQKVSQAAMARMIGLTSQSAMSEMLSGKRQVKVQEADAIYRVLGLSPTDSVAVVSVPIIGLASAGKWREAVEMPLGRIPMPRTLAGSKAFAVEIAGDSMDKLLDDGGWIVVDPDDKVLKAGKCYLLQNSDFEVTVKQYQSAPARFEPVSTNEDHQPFEVADCDFVVLGRVVWKGERM